MTPATGYWMIWHIIYPTSFFQSLAIKQCFFPRDCYYNIKVLENNPNAAFSHVIAGYYAGVGSIGDSHNLITKEFGSHHRIVFLTDPPIPSDKMLKTNLCIHCKKCTRSCPSKCFSEDQNRIYYMDKVACTKYHI